MVAVIHVGSSLREALNYNESKVKKGVPELIDAGFYLKESAQLSFTDKLSRLKKRISLNERVKINTLHISLNFAAEDQLPAGRLKQIASQYLDKIGFAKQPYLLYEHHDVAHQHVHIVTTNIRADGSSIKLHNIGKVRSEAARKQIEIEFGLVRAQDHKRQGFDLKPLAAARIQYGKSQTKQAISIVLHSILKDYKFTSLAELNAVLNQYNVLAERGSEDSRIYKKRGLVYRVLDESGNRVGVPIKASDFHFKPTLKYLEGRFEASEKQREKYKARLKNSIDEAMQWRGFDSLSSFSLALKNEGVTTVFRRSSSGQLYGITYVDHRTKSVFNGSDLGKPYSAKAIQQRLISAISINESIAFEEINGGKSISQQPSDSFGKSQNAITVKWDAKDDNSLIEDLLKAENSPEQTPWELRKNRKNKRRRLTI